MSTYLSVITPARDRDCHFPLKTSRVNLHPFPLKGHTCKGTRAQNLVHNRGRDKLQSAARSRARTEAWLPCKGHSLLRGTSATAQRNWAEIPEHQKRTSSRQIMRGLPWQHFSITVFILTSHSRCRALQNTLSHRIPETTIPIATA